MAAILYSRICQIVFRFVFKGIGMTFHYAKKLSCNTKMHDLDVRLPTMIGITLCPHWRDWTKSTTNNWLRGISEGNSA